MQSYNDMPLIFKDSNAHGMQIMTIKPETTRRQKRLQMSNSRDNQLLPDFVTDIATRMPTKNAPSLYSKTRDSSSHQVVNDYAQDSITMKPMTKARRGKEQKVGLVQGRNTPQTAMSSLIVQHHRGEQYHPGAPKSGTLIRAAESE